MRLVRGTSLRSRGTTVVQRPRGEAGPFRAGAYEERLRLGRRLLLTYGN